MPIGLRCIMRLSQLLFLCSVQVLSVISQEYDRTGEGYPGGYLGDCPGSTMNMTIPGKYMREVFFIVNSQSKGSKTAKYRKRFDLLTAAQDMASDPNLDLKGRKTVMFVSGFLDSTNFPASRMVGDAYAKRQYNVISLDTSRLTSYAYPVSARLVRALGRKVGETIADMHKRQIIDVEELEILAISLGCHTSGFIAKTFLQITGRKISRITALDPAGPCFRHRSPEDRLDKNDAKFIDVLHTNMDGLGIAASLGHVDFYVNGGEYQVSYMVELPCSFVCSHLRSVYLWLSALANPSKFVGLKCDTIQQARDRSCYDRVPQETNLVGLEVDRKTQGIFYLSTSNVEPYFLGHDGLVKNKDNYNMYIRSLYKIML